MWRVSRIGTTMAKRKRSKGKRRGGKRKSKKGGHKSPKHSLLLEGAAIWDGYKFVTTDGIGAAMIKAPFDKAQRANVIAYLKHPAAKANLMNNTRELQMVALFKVAQKVPVIKGPANAAARVLNSLGRQFGLKGKYKVI